MTLLYEAGVLIDREIYESALRYENCNRNLAECSSCLTPPNGQHASECPFASILWRLADCNFHVRKI
jgi:hypothetical protein